MTPEELEQSYLNEERREALRSCRRRKRTTIYGLGGSSLSLALAGLVEKSKPILMIADSEDDAGYIYHDVSTLIGEERTAILPSGFKRDIRYGQKDPANEILRIETLGRLADKTEKLQVVVTYPEAVAERVASRETLADNTLTFAKGGTADISDTAKWLRARGFCEVDYVYEPGQYAIRGSLLDIFAYSNPLPYRIDFFGDDIESLRTFNTETQLSEEKFDNITIAADAGNTSKHAENISLLEFMGEDTMICLRDEYAIIQRIKSIAESTVSDKTLLTGEGDLDATKLLVDGIDFANRLTAMKTVTLTAKATVGDDIKGAYNFNCTHQGMFHKNFDLISETLLKYIQDGYKLLILSDNPKQFERLRAIFADRGEDIPFAEVQHTLHEGFVDHLTKRCIFTDHQIFDRFHKYTLRSEKVRSGKLALSLKELGQIENGDYIVHADHGVGRFGGLLRTNVNGRSQEMIKLVYQNNDIIFVSIHALHKLSKYRGKEGVAPKINRIGSGAWQKVKDRAKSKLKYIARDLIKLYAARKEEKGFAFSPDSYLQHELEASFIYEDTPDQLTAVQAIKEDMESARPMDRLLCGDVGFGKTEVAVRAAFKAVADSKQVAVLVPTTVLAYQHFNTFTQRLKDFPARVEYLSRARTSKETKQILEDLREGKIDIIVGTHKLIGKNVQFKDLGLLIIDEEQKFGVAVKEKLKQMKVNVDTLTMSATPIPRTLQFSLVGARDLSTINTPPPNRYPIVTTVTAMSDEMLAEAVNFEMARGGQVFIINNRIEGLAALEAQLKRVVPDARVITAHGQMNPEQLEKAIEDFTAHDYDVLIATTIVESGIDMPRVNTIIVNNAQNFGLSELHQLRGRVGRSSRKAFCYLLVPPTLTLSDVARRRLSAIESFSDLGSGIRIAMQDLDIRGAGNLLGAEQSGFVADLGFETYQKIIREAVTELRTEEFADLGNGNLAKRNAEDDFVADCVVETDLELLLPATYVPQENERITLYRELDSVERELDLQAFKSRLEDRFGRIPKETAELLRIPRLRRLARTIGVEKVVIKQDTMYLYFVGDENKAYYQSPMFGRVLNYLQHNAKRVKLREKNGRRSFSIANVKTVETAVDILQNITQMDAI